MSKKNKILVVVESIDVNDSSGTKGRVALIKNMIASGFEVTVLHYTQKELTISGANCKAINEPRFTWSFLMSRIQRYVFRWFKINIGELQEKLHGFSFTWINASKALARAVKLYDPEDFDMLWTMGKGTSFRPHAALLKCPQWHKKWYAYVHDPYPQHLYPRPYNFVEYGFKKKRYFFRDVTQQAKKIVFPSQLLKEWMQSYFVDIESKSVIIPHQLATRTIQKEAPMPSFFDSNKFNILHAGNLLDLRDPKPLVEAYMLFLEKNPEAQNDSALIFIGKPSTFDMYLKTSKNNVPSLFNSDGYVDFELVNMMQHKTSVNVILEAQSEISPFLPGKFTHCVAANKPILLIGPYYSECKRLLGQDYTLSFDFDQKEAIATAIAQLYQQWKNDKELLLDRPDLTDYVSVSYLEKTLKTLI